MAQLEDGIMSAEHAAGYDEDDFQQPEPDARSAEREAPSLGPDRAPLEGWQLSMTLLESPAEAQFWRQP